MAYYLSDHSLSNELEIVTFLTLTTEVTTLGKNFLNQIDLL